MGSGNLEYISLWKKCVKWYYENGSLGNQAQRKNKAYYQEKYMSVVNYFQYLYKKGLLEINLI